MPITDYLETLDVDALVWIVWDMLPREILWEIWREAQISCLQWYSEEEAFKITFCAFIAKYCADNKEEDKVIAFMNEHALTHFDINELI